MEEVTVTAQKREQVLAEIPMSVTVLPGDMLEKQNAYNFQDLTSLVPGLSITGSVRGVTRITLRGINTGGVASTVGVYVDEVPFGSSSGLANGAVLSGDFDTFDVARIEDLDALNRLLFAWVEGEYHVRGHRGIEGETPLDRWMRLSDGIRSLPQDVDLEELFMSEVERRVGKDGTLSVKGPGRKSKPPATTVR